MTVDMKGHLIFSHTRDPDWDINDFLLEMKSQLHSWRDVYWRVWGIVNFLQCAHCNGHFPCTNFGHCLFHPIHATFDSTATTPDADGNTVSSVVSAVGRHLCCNQVVLRFDPTQTNNVSLIVRSFVSCFLVVFSEKICMKLNELTQAVCHSNIMQTLFCCYVMYFLFNCN